MTAGKTAFANILRVKYRVSAILVLLEKNAIEVSVFRISSKVVYILFYIKSEYILYTTIDYDLFSVEFVLSSNCTSVINESNQMITYSEFSPSAQNQLSCFWTIKAPADRIVKLTFIDLNINCGSSTLKLHDGEDLQSPNIASICGRSLSEEIDSSDNFFTISLIMNDRSKVTSFKIGYKVVGKDYKFILYSSNI